MTIMTQTVSLGGSPLAVGEVAHLWRRARYGDLDGLTARFRSHSYAMHSHPTFVIGTIIEGCETYTLRGAKRFAAPGHLCFVNPEEPHDGEPLDEGFAYRTIYPSIALIGEIAAEAAGRPLAGRVGFREPIVRDPGLARQFAAAHRALEEDRSELEADGRMVTVLARMLERHADVRPRMTGLSEPRAVERARSYLAEHVADRVDLATLASVAGLSRFHFIRAFRKATGLTPHAYLLDRRVHLAQEGLRRGETPAAVAMAAGFADQAHLTRAFKARVGVTPGHYARASASAG